MLRLAVKTLDPSQILVINLKMTDRKQLLSSVMPDLHMLKLGPISSIITLFIPPICRAFQHTLYVYVLNVNMIQDWNPAGQLWTPRVHALMKHLHIYRC